MAPSKAIARRPAELEIGVAWPKIRKAWARYLQREHASLTGTAYLRAMGQFWTWLERRAAEAKDPLPSLAAITADDVVAWRESLRRHYSVATVNLNLGAVRSFYNWAIAQGAPIANPAQGVRGRGRKIDSPHKRDCFTDQEVLALLDSCRYDDIGTRDRAILSLMAYCGLRTIEVQRAEVGDLETREGRQILWVWGKGRHEPDDFVVLPAPAEASLRAWLDRHPTGTGSLFCTLGRGHKGRPMDLRTLRHMGRLHMRRAGIRRPRLSLHSLRHSATSNAIRHDANPVQVQHMLRHSDIKSTIRYFHETERLTDPAEDRILYEEARK